MSKPCPKCGSTALVERLEIATGGEMPRELSIRTEHNPGALFFTGTQLFPIDATVCGDCGHTELTTRDFRKLAAAVRENRRGR